MEFGPGDSIVLFGLLAASVTLLALAPRLRVPYPILLVLGGLALGFTPGLPHVELPPDLVLIGVLPPLLYGAAFFTSLRDLRTNARPISLLAVGLVVLTTVVVAVVAHSVVPSFGWLEAFVLGAVVSPTDPIAATVIARRLGVPRRIVAVIEGESLVNDGTGLVLYRFAVAAVVTGSFTLWEVGVRLVLVALGGIAVGLAVGWVVRQARKRIDNPPVEITISLLTGYFAYLPAEALGVSGVLAAVTVGIYMGWHTPELTNAQVRLQADAVWSILVFVLNALVFVLVGLQLPTILDGIDHRSPGRLVWYAAAVSLAVILTRIAWVFPATYLPRWLSRRLRERDPSPSWRNPAVISWAGMRGTVSLAAALSIPLTVDTGSQFPNRNLIVFLTFSVILATLVFQGLTLPLVIRGLGLEADNLDEREEAKARVRAAEAALERLEKVAPEEWVRGDTAERFRRLYDFRRSRFEARFDDDDDGAIEERSTAYQRLRQHLLDAEREAILELRRSGEIGDEALNRVLRDIDLEEERLDV